MQKHLVQWSGWPYETATWEGPENLEDAMDTVEHFKNNCNLFDNVPNGKEVDLVTILDNEGCRIIKKLRDQAEAARLAKLPPVAQSYRSGGKWKSRLHGFVEEKEDDLVALGFDPSIYKSNKREASGSPFGSDRHVAKKTPGRDLRKIFDPAPRFNRFGEEFDDLFDDPDDTLVDAPMEPQFEQGSSQPASGVTGSSADDLGESQNTHAGSCEEAPWNPSSQAASPQVDNAAAEAFPEAAALQAEVRRQSVSQTEALTAKESEVEAAVATDGNGDGNGILVHGQAAASFNGQDAGNGHGITTGADYLNERLGINNGQDAEGNQNQVDDQVNAGTEDNAELRGESVSNGTTDVNGNGVTQSIEHSFGNVTQSAAAMPTDGTAAAAPVSSAINTDRAATEPTILPESVPAKSEGEEFKSE